MNIRKGDRVKFLNDTGGGVVTEITDSKMALVLIDDGFEVPVPIRELINDEPASAYGSDKPDRGRDPEKTVEQEWDEEEETAGGASDNPDYDDPSGELFPGGVPAREKPVRNLLLGLVKSGKKDQFETWLINDSRFSVYFAFLQRDEELFRNISSGRIEADSKILLGTFTREEANSSITWRVQALFTMKGVYEPVSPSQSDYTPDPVELFSGGAMVDNDYFETAAMVVPLISDPHERELQKLREQEVSRLTHTGRTVKSSATPATSPGSPRKDPLVEEVDLHISELLDDPSAVSGREALDIQMARFTTALEGALRGNTRRIVFIHGIGNGKLKFEIRKTLDRKYPRLKYQDASFSEYGYGATLVIIRK